MEPATIAWAPAEIEAVLAKDREIAQTPESGVRCVRRAATSTPKGASDVTIMRPPPAIALLPRLTGASLVPRSPQVPRSQTPLCSRTLILPPPPPMPMLRVPASARSTFVTRPKAMPASPVPRTSRDRLVEALVLVSLGIIGFAVGILAVAAMCAATHHSWL